MGYVVHSQDFAYGMAASVWFHQGLHLSNQLLTHSPMRRAKFDGPMRFSPTRIDANVPFIRIGDVKGPHSCPVHISCHPSGTALLELAREEEGNLSADMSMHKVSELLHKILTCGFRRPFPYQQGFLIVVGDCLLLWA